MFDLQAQGLGLRNHGNTFKNLDLIASFMFRTRLEGIFNVKSKLRQKTPIYAISTL